jgi:hypothetical protein
MRRRSRSDGILLGVALVIALYFILTKIRFYVVVPLGLGGLALLLIGLVIIIYVVLKIVF